MLLYRLHRLALHLQALRPLCLLAALAGLFLSVRFMFVVRAGPSLHLSLALMLTLWALMLFAFIQLFRRIPPPVLPQDSFTERLRSRARLLLYQLLALAVAMLGAGLLTLSLKLLAAS